MGIVGMLGIPSCAFLCVLFALLRGEVGTFGKNNGRLGNRWLKARKGCLDICFLFMFHLCFGWVLSFGGCLTYIPHWYSSRIFDASWNMWVGYPLFSLEMTESMRSREYQREGRTWKKGSGSREFLRRRPVCWKKTASAVGKLHWGWVARPRRMANVNVRNMKKKISCKKTVKCLDQMVSTETLLDGAPPALSVQVSSKVNLFVI